MSTLKGTTMHPRCRHIGACWDLLEWFQPFSTSQNTSRIQFRTFLKKKNQIFWFPCCSTREDLSVDVSITYVGLILTKPGRFLFSAYGNSGYGQNSIWSISNFLTKFQISGFPWCRTREDHSIDVLITNVGLGFRINSHEDKIPCRKKSHEEKIPEVKIPWGQNPRGQNPIRKISQEDISYFVHWNILQLSVFQRAIIIDHVILLGFKVFKIVQYTI